jgi:hypothetical protein
MSIPRKHHYLPQFFLNRWCIEGRLTEFRRPHGILVSKRRYPAATCYATDLYTDESQNDPVARQALESGFMQEVDDRAANSLVWLEANGCKPHAPISATDGPGF